MYPHFIGIGAQKAGTTWLSRNLQAHPGIWMPSIKELHYFDERIQEPANPFSRIFRKISGKSDRDRRWRRQVRRRSARHFKYFSKQAFLWDLKYYAARPDDGWYASLFEPGRGRVTGEITPAYSTLGRDVVAHVHALAPDAKIILMLRNPIERAWSQAVMRLDRTGERSDDAGRLRRLFDREGSRTRTDYFGTLENWGSFYPENKIFLGFLEDIHFFPSEFLGGVYDFLGVDASFKPPGVGERIHARSVGRVPTVSMSYLAGSYCDETARLDDRFGGYASFWHHCAGRLSEDPPDGEIPYPLWESYLWKEWVGEARFQSGRLSEMGGRQEYGPKEGGGLHERGAPPASPETQTS